MGINDVCAASSISSPIIVVHYATQAAHRIHTQNIKTIKHKKTKTTKNKNE